MIFHSIDPTTTREEILDMVKKIESFRGDPHFDGADPLKASVGFGFNLEAGDNLFLVLDQVYGSAVLDINQFIGDFQAGIGFVRPTTKQFLTNPTFFNNQLQSFLDGLVNQNLLPGATFQSFQMTEPEGDGVIGQILDGYTINGTFKEGKIARLEDRLMSFGLSIPKGSKEFVALSSMFYNTEDFFTSDKKLVQALQVDNRAEAWFEIRYRSNGERLSNPALAPGIAKRRYWEAEVFHLYDPGVTEANITEEAARQVLRMYTVHREAIKLYESEFGENLDGTPGQRNMILEANNDYGLNLPGDAPVDTLAQALTPARTFFITQFAQFANAPAIAFPGDVLVGGDTAEGDSLSGTQSNDLILGEGGDDKVEGAAGPDILYGGDGRDELRGGTENDFLFGGAGEDFLDGGAGDDELDGGADNDVLVGGLDNDTLKGGSGFDIYINNVGDGQDTIDDSDGVGVLVYDNGALTGGVRQVGDPAGTFVSTSGRFQYVQTGADLVISDLLNAGNVLTVQTFHNPDFGIRLVDASGYTPATRPAGFYDNALATETADGTEGSDGIGPIGGSGASSVNIISSLLGGNDWIFAHDASEGNHQFFGGLGNDQLEGSLGRDQLFGEAGQDFLLADEGDDALDGGAELDILQAFSGDDILLGGDGDDWLLADDRSDFVDNRPVGHDFLDGGSGNDLLFAGLGGDRLEGGSGHDELYGDNIGESRKYRMAA